MHHTHLILEILTGIFIGWLAGHIVQGKGLGLIGDLFVGAFGAFLGAALVHFFHLHVAGFWGDFGVCVGGAVLLLIFIRIIFK